MGRDTLSSLSFIFSVEIMLIIVCLTSEIIKKSNFEGEEIDNLPCQL